MSEKQNIGKEIIKDISEITCRLFDHRPFLNGEINLFLNEFELNRGDLEIENLFLTIQKITESKLYANKCKISSENHLKRFENTINKVLSSITDILVIEENSNLDEILKQNRNTRSKLWEDFIADEEYKKERIDLTFEQKKEELCEFYSDLEQKLHIHV